MTQREEFEAWFKRDFHPDKSGPYLKNMLQEAWQASRQSLAVEFTEEMTPDLHGDDYRNKVEAAYCEGYNKALSDIESAIESAGIKVVSND